MSCPSNILSNILAGLPGSAKGDLLVYNGTEWKAFTVGTDEQIIFADSTQTLGLRWDTLNGVSHGVQTFTSQTSVTVVHNLGLETKWKVFVATDSIIPETETQTINDFTFTFSIPQTGYVVYSADAGYSAGVDSVVDISNTYTVLPQDDIITISGSNSFDITFPDSTGFPRGKGITITHLGTGSVNAVPTGLQTIEGLASFPILPGSLGAYNSYTFYRDTNDNWLIK